MLENKITLQEKCTVQENDYHADLSSNLTKYPGLKLVNIGRVRDKICPILFCIDIVFSVSIRSVPAGKVLSRSSIVPAIICDNFVPNAHAVSFDWFLSGLEWMNLEFRLLQILLFYQKLLWNIRSRINSWFFEPVFEYAWWISSFLVQKAPMQA